jgi:hypothetical protein
LNRIYGFGTAIVRGGFMPSDGHIPARGPLHIQR